MDTIPGPQDLVLPLDIGVEVGTVIREDVGDGGGEEGDSEVEVGGTLIQDMAVMVDHLMTLMHTTIGVCLKIHGRTSYHQESKVKKQQLHPCYQIAQLLIKMMMTTKNRR